MANFAIIGCGNIANKAAEAMKLVPTASLVAVASKKEEKARDFALKHNVKSYYDDYNKVYTNPEVDIIYIATTCNFHYQNIKDALLNGKNVIAEKTMVETKAQAEELFKIAEEKGVFLFEGMWSLFIPTINKVKEWISEGRIGDVSLAYYLGGINAPADNRIFKKELGGGSFLDLTVYPYEIVSYVLGKTGKAVKSDIVYENGVDTINSAILNFGDTKCVIATTAHARIPSPSGFFGNKGYVLIEQTHRANIVKLYDCEFNEVDKFECEFTNGFEYEMAHAVKLFENKKTESNIASKDITISFLSFLEESLNGIN